MNIIVMGKQMGHGNKINFIFIGGLLFIMVILNTCVLYPAITYSILDTSGKRLTTVNKDIHSYNELTNKGSVLYIEFSRIGNRFYYQISISLFTLNEYHVFKIHDLEFEFEGQKKIVKVNNEITLNQIPNIFSNRLFIVEEYNDLSVDTFFNYLYKDHNSIKLYLQNIFNKKDKDVGNKFELKLKVNYSLDNGNILTQEINYLVSIRNNNPSSPEWMYRLFPGW